MSKFLSITTPKQYRKVVCCQPRITEVHGYHFLPVNRKLRDGNYANPGELIGHANGNIALCQRGMHCAILLSCAEYFNPIGYDVNQQVAWLTEVHLTKVQDWQTHGTKVVGRWREIKAMHLFEVNGRCRNWGAEKVYPSDQTMRRFSWSNVLTTIDVARPDDLTPARQPRYSKGIVVL